MKKFFFAVPLLSIAILFAFCHKTTLQEEATPQKNDLKVSGRGLCDVRIGADNIAAVFEICGNVPPAQTTQNCIACGTVAATNGTTFQGGILLNDVVTPAGFSISNISSVDAWVTVRSDNIFGPIFIPAGGCASFYVSDNCIVY